MNAISRLCWPGPLPTASPPHLQLAPAGLGCLQSLPAAPQLLLQVWQAARALPQRLGLLAVQLGPFGLSRQRLGLSQMSSWDRSTSGQETGRGWEGAG